MRLNLRLMFSSDQTLKIFDVTLSEAKGLVLHTNEILRFAQNDRLSSCDFWCYRSVPLYPAISVTLLLPFRFLSSVRNS